MKRSYLLLPLVTLSLFSNIINDLHTTEDKAQSIFVASLGQGMLQAESEIVKAARSLPGPIRVEGTKQLIRIARNYSETESFARAYRKWREERLGYRQKPRGLKIPSIRKMVDKAVDKQMNKGEDEQKYPADPKEMIRKRLKEFLELSSGVDFDASVVGGRFESPAYEAKDNRWKMCFRAGKPVIDAAREEAEKWLKELE